MTDQEVNEWNAQIDRSEAIFEAISKERAGGLLARLVMPEDKKVARKYKHQPVRLAARHLADQRFEHDPEERARKLEITNRDLRSKAKKYRTLNVHVKRRPGERFQTWQARVDAKKEEKTLGQFG